MAKGESTSNQSGEQGEDEWYGGDYRNLRRFIGYIFRYRVWLIFGALTAAWRMILPLFMPLFAAFVIDFVIMPALEGEVTAGEAYHTLWLILAVFVGLAAVHAIVTLGRFYLPQVAIGRAIRDLRFDLYAHLQRLSLGFHTQRATGGIVARVISDVKTAQRVIERLLIVSLQQGVRSAVIVFILFWFDWLWALVALSTMPLFLFVTRLIRGRLREASRQVQESVERMSGHVQERMAMIQEVQGFTAEEHEEQIIREEVERWKDYTLRARLLNGFLVSSSEITRFGGLAVVMAFGVYRVIDGPATVGALVAFFAYTRTLLQPLQFFANLYGQTHEAAAAADRVFEFLDAEPKITDAPDAKPLTLATAPDVRFDHVRFAYPTDDPRVVLNDVTFTAPGGSRVAVVGASGAGKSTLLSLIPRFYDVQGGRIIIGEHDVTQLQVKSLREQIAIVPQEPVLFSGTIRDNILYGKRDANDEQIVAAAKAANAHTFIVQTPEGYDSEIGERGTGLSGGQIQRIAIARAFLNDPKILILDEATSNLDAVSESQVLAAIERLAKGRTTFIIAHRLSTAREAAMIVVLEDGKIAEIGTHEELLDREGEYASLWARQVHGVETASP